MRFLNFFLNHMVQKYQNEIAPIFYYGISTKTNEKDLRIPNLQPPDWKSPYWMTLYIMSPSSSSCCLSPGRSCSRTSGWGRRTSSPRRQSVRPHSAAAASPPAGTCLWYGAVQYSIGIVQNSTVQYILNSAEPHLSLQSLWEASKTNEHWWNN